MLAVNVSAHRPIGLWSSEKKGGLLAQSGSLVFDPVRDAIAPEFQ
jgi:hypothetical protein